MKCSNCGEVNSQSAQFCAGCGFPLTASEAETQSRKEYLPTKKSIVCEKCGRANTVWSDSSMRYCTGCGTVIFSSVLPTADYASFPVRLAAAVADIFISVPLGVILLVVLVKVSPHESTLPLLFLLSLPLYHWIFLSWQGRTLGKMIFGIKVTNTQGNKPSVASSWLREFIGKLISTVLLFAGFLLSLVDSNKQGLHDKIAGTFVVVNRKPKTKN